LNDQDFATRWNASRSPSVLARELGVSTKSVTNRACRLRRRGLELRRFLGGRPNLDVPPERFAAIWNESNDIGEVADKIGVTRNAIYVRAYRLRDQGLRLKRFDGPGRPFTSLDHEARHGAAIRKGRELAAACFGLDPARLRTGPDMLTRFAFHVAAYLARVHGDVPLRAFQAFADYDSSAVVRSCRYVRQVAEDDEVFARRLHVLEATFRSPSTTAA
jgi:biotin operon repressor